jgi:predicted acylesterase/phospholipase RssA
MPTAGAETGLVLPGGGARAAYQVGALRAIARVLSKRAAQPFPVICGTSAGAINAAVLGVHADSFRRGVGRLLRLWRNITVTDVYRADLATLGSFCPTESTRRESARTSMPDICMRSRSTQRAMAPATRSRSTTPRPRSRRGTACAGAESAAGSKSIT